MLVLGDVELDLVALDLPHVDGAGEESLQTRHDSPASAQTGAIGRERATEPLLRGADGSERRRDVGEDELLVTGGVVPLADAAVTGAIG